MPLAYELSDMDMSLLGQEPVSRDWPGITNVSDPDIEAEYCKHVSIEVHKQTKILARWLNLCGVLLLVLDQVKAYVLLGENMAPNTFMNVMAAVVILNVGLRFSSEATSEYYICACVLGIMSVSLAFNEFRVARFELLPFNVLAEFDEDFLRKCSADLVEGARDCQF